MAENNPTRQLLLAAARGDVLAIQELLAQGADINAGINPNDGEVASAKKHFDFLSALTLSVFCGCADVASELIAAGAEPGEDDLVNAIGLNQPKIGRVMLEAMALPNGDADELFYIPMLAKRMRSEFAATFREDMARLILTGEWSEEAARLAIKRSYEAAWVQDPNDEIFALLDALIARARAVDTPAEELHEALRDARQNASRNGDVLFVRGLSARGVALPEGWTAGREKEVQIVGAASSGNEPGLALLLGEGVSPNAASVDGRYALAAALEHGYVTFAEQLLDAGADPGRFGSRQASPLASAAGLDHAPLVGRLIEMGAVADQIDGTGSFPLQVAARNGATQAIIQLLERGASPGFTDGKQRTALHELIKPDRVRWPSPPRVTPVTYSHHEAVRLTTAAGLPLGALDARGNSVLTSNIDRESPSLALVRELLAAGAEPGVADLERAIEIEDAPLLRTLLLSRAPGPLPASLLIRSSSRLSHSPDLAVTLLENGVALPTASLQQRQLLVGAIRAPSATALAMLLSRGLPLSAASEVTVIEAAISAGRPASVELLVARGANVHATDSRGRTALHRIIADDTSGNLRAGIGDPQRAAIAALIDAGFSLSTADAQGNTVSMTAGARATTLTALNQAIAMAGANATGIHAAIRASRFEELRRLAADSAMLESHDALGRTPLSLALQLKNWPAARILLRAGATISLTPAQPWLPADSAFAGERALASAFAVRLLSATLIDIPSNRTPTGIQALRQAFRDGRTLPFADFKWHVRCEGQAVTCGDGVTVAGNRKFLDDLIESQRFDHGDETGFNFIQRNIRSINLTLHTSTGILGAGGPSQLHFGEVTFSITGSLAIQPCAFAFEDPGCSPGVRIHNPNTDRGLILRTNSGFERLPSANFLYSQENGASGVIGPGETVVLDRSTGGIKLEMDRVQARVFSFGAKVARVVGEDVVPLPADASTANRMAVYARLAQLHSLRRSTPTNAAERAADKTVASTIAALSAEAWQANYPTVVLALLRQQADVVAGIDLQVRDIQRAVLAQASYTPAQIQVLIAQVDVALASLSDGDNAVLRTIREELVRLLVAAEETGVAVNALRNTLFTTADLKIETYQALVLEYRQYMPSSALDDALDIDVRRAVAARISGREVLIDDSTMGGTGRKLRAQFGLPDPHP
ncbi:MAG: ankyrin repeat domain-containing protein [Gammaproteobacteria bacterium]|nr:ankyrin repeat domain-containing protein [Gammaproteobacteria bacterium]